MCGEYGLRSSQGEIKGLPENDICIFQKARVNLKEGMQLGCFLKIRLWAVLIFSHHYDCQGSYLLG